jgi:hypothetical protein
MLRGASKVGRNRNLVIGSKKRKRNDFAVLKEANSKQDASTSRCESTQRLESSQQRESEPRLKSAAPDKLTRKPLKHARFDEDSDWIDVSDEDIPNRYQEEQDGIYFTIDGDEYVIL